MRSVILSQTTRFLFPLLTVLSVFVLYRGHNLPGGGFIGGLIAASGFALLAIADGVAAAEAKLRIRPAVLIGLGLGLALLSGVFALFKGEVFMKALWLPEFSLPFLGTVHLGTPTLFDVGVYLAVAGFALKALFSLFERTEYL